MDEPTHSLTLAMFSSLVKQISARMVPNGAREAYLGAGARTASALQEVTAVRLAQIDQG